MDIKMIIQLLAERRQLRAREHWTRKLLEDYQAQALRVVREDAYAHSPFYQQFHQGLYDAPLQDLPVLTKGMLMDHFDDLVTDRTLHLQEVGVPTFFPFKIPAKRDALMEMEVRIHVIQANRLITPWSLPSKEVSSGRGSHSLSSKDSGFLQQR